MNTAAERLLRQQEIIADIAFNCGAYWNRMPDSACAQIMDNMDGSRSLIGQFISWASEFDVMWESLDEDDNRRENYIGEVDDFAHSKMNELVAQFVADRLEQ